MHVVVKVFHWQTTHFAFYLCSCAHSTPRRQHSWFVRIFTYSPGFREYTFGNFTYSTTTAPHSVVRWNLNSICLRCLSAWSGISISFLSKERKNESRETLLRKTARAWISSFSCKPVQTPLLRNNLRIGLSKPSNYKKSIEEGCRSQTKRTSFNLFLIVNKFSIVFVTIIHVWFPWFLHGMTRW